MVVFLLTYSGVIQWWLIITSVTISLGVAAPSLFDDTLFDETVRLKETSRFDTKSFRYKSFRYELKQWNCTSFSIKYSLRINGKKYLGVNIPRPCSLSQARETFLMTESTCVETTANLKNPAIRIGSSLLD